MEVVNVIVQGVLLGGLYALFAAGLSLIFGVMRLVNIAHGDLIVVAAYFAYFTMQALDIGPFTSLIVVVPVIAVARDATLLGRSEGGRSPIRNGKESRIQRVRSAARV